MFCQLFSLQNKSFLCLQYVENKGFQTVIKHRLKAIQKHIKNELGNREKNTKNAHFVLKKCTFRFRDYNTKIVKISTKNVFLRYYFGFRREIAPCDSSVLHFFDGWRSVKFMDGRVGWDIRGLKFLVFRGKKSGCPGMVFPV